MSNKSTIILFLIFFISLIENGYAYQNAPISSQTLPDSLLILKLKAERLNNEGLWEESIHLYQSIRKKCTELNLEKAGIDLYEDIFAVTVLREDYNIEDKLAFIEQCSKKEQHQNFMGLYYGGIAHAYIYYGEVDSMNKYYTLSYNAYKKDKRHKRIAYLNVTIAIEYYFLGNLIIAKQYLQKAEKLLEEKLEPIGLGLPSIYPLQTAIYTELGEYDKALKSNLSSIELYEKDSTTPIISLSREYSNLATTYSALEDFKNALNYYQKALNLITSTPNYPPNEVASLLYNIGATHNEQHNYHTGISPLLKSLAILNEIEELNQDMQEDFINNCHQLAGCYIHFNRLDSALYYVRKAEEVNQTFPYRLATTYFCYGEIYLKQKNLKKAEFYSLKSLEEGIRAYGEKSEFVLEAYLELSKITAAKYRYKDALLYCQKALESLSINFSDEEGLSNPILKDIFRKGDLLTVLELKMQYLEILYVRDDQSVTKEDLYETAKLATECLEVLNKSLKNKGSQLYWLNQQAIPLFEKAIQIAISIYNKTNNIEYLNEAFMLSEHSKSMLMMSTLQEENASSFGGIPDALVQQEKDLQKQLVEAEKRRFDANLIGDSPKAQFEDSLIFHYNHQIDLLAHQFEMEFPKYYQLKYATQVASISAVQEVLEEKTTFIEYFEGTTKIYAFTITKDSAFVHVIPKTISYNLDISNFQSILVDISDLNSSSANIHNKFIDASYRFYTEMLENSLVSGQNRLIIIPDGQLGYIPFDALLTYEVEPIANQSNSRVNFSTLPYLIRDYTISYNYSATLLINQKEQQKQRNNGNILALAPTYEHKTAPAWRSAYEQKLRTELVELPGAVRELNFLKWAFNGYFLAGLSANETQFKKNASDYSILHLAVHGLVDNKRPELSGLALEEDMSKQEDNILYAYEIKQLNLQAELVVLSACETGIGKYQRGEGVLSIGRGFMYAGVPSLLTTLWSLNDYSSSIIIEQFYNNLSEGMEKDEAIRQAKLFYLDNYSGLSTYPALWACFIQVGDYSSIKINKNYWLLYSIVGGFLGLLIIIGFIKKIKE